MYATVAGDPALRVRKRGRRLVSAPVLLRRQEAGTSASTFAERGRPTASVGVRPALAAALVLSAAMHAAILAVLSSLALGPATAPERPIPVVWAGAERAVSGDTMPVPSPDTGGSANTAPRAATPRSSRKAMPEAPPRRRTPDRGTDAVAASEPPSSESSFRAPARPEAVPADPGNAIAGSAVPAPSTGATAAPSGVVLRRVRGGRQAQPVYPDRALRLGLEGVTLLRVRVDPAGRVGEIRIERSAGGEDFDRSAREAVRRWRFEAAAPGDAPGDVWVLVPIEFRLRERSP